jgi:hypothetical protein
MYVVVRRYRDARAVLDALEQGSAEVERLLRDTRGFPSYYLARHGDDGFSVTVCQDRIGAEESNLLAADWTTENAPTAAGNTPEVIEGETILHVEP